MPKKVLVFSPFALANPHLEATLEVAKKEASEGAEIVFYSCSGALRDIGPIGCHNVFGCLSCQSRQKASREILDKIPNLQQKKISLEPSLKKVVIPSFKDVGSLKSFRIDSLPVGQTVYSTFVSRLRTVDFSTTRYQRRLKQSALKCYQLYLQLMTILEDESPDKFYFFNGRLSLTRPCVWACQSQSIDYVVLEIGSTYNKYIALENYTPHDFGERKKEIEIMWGEAQSLTSERELLAEKWFHERRQRKVQNYIVYSKNQSFGKIPEISTSAKVLSIFPTSEDETAAYDDWKSPLYDDQITGIQKILRDLNSPLERGEKQVFIRVHPNIAGSYSVNRAFLRLHNPQKNVFVIPADSDVDSYALLDQSDLVIVFGSTIGVEAAFSQKKVLLLGRALYEDLKVCSIPSSHEEVIKKIRELDSLELPLQEDALKYAYWAGQQGQLYEYYKADQLNSGTFMGRDLKASSLWEGLFAFSRALETMWTLIVSPSKFFTLFTRFKQRLVLKKSK